MIYETLLTEAGSCLLISMLEKVSLFCLTGLVKLVLLHGMHPLQLQGGDKNLRKEFAGVGVTNFYFGGGRRGVSQNLKSSISVANKGLSVVNYCQSLAFDHPYLLCNAHCAFSRNLFFINIVLISYKFFSTILNLFSWDLNTFTKHKEQVCFLFICSFFICCFVIILCINALHLFILFCCV